MKMGCSWPVLNFLSTACTFLRSSRFLGFRFDRHCHFAEKKNKNYCKNCMQVLYNIKHGHFAEKKKNHFKYCKYCPCVCMYMYISKY
jgi:hypothetical protein